VITLTRFLLNANALKTVTVKPILVKRLKKLKIVVASRRVLLYITGIKCKKDLEHQSEYKVGMNMQVTYKTTAKGKVTGATGTLLGHFVF
jgi:hypothetical protein